MILLGLALTALALFWLARLRLRPVKACRRCVGVGCHRCGGDGYRFRRGVSVAHRRR